MAVLNDHDGVPLGSIIQTSSMTCLTVNDPVMLMDLQWRQSFRKCYITTFGANIIFISYFGRK